MLPLVNHVIPMEGPSNSGLAIGMLKQMFERLSEETSLRNLSSSCGTPISDENASMREDIRTDATTAFVVRCLLGVF